MAAGTATADHETSPTLVCSKISPCLLSYSTSTAAPPVDSFTTLKMRQTTTRPAVLALVGYCLYTSRQTTTLPPESSPTLLTALHLVLKSCSTDNIYGSALDPLSTNAALREMGDLGFCPTANVHGSSLDPRQTMREMIDFGNDEFFTKAKFCWTKQNPMAVGRVWNQGKTWTCWAHVVMDTVSAIDYLNNGNLSILSVQELVDCMHCLFYPGKQLCLDPYGNETAAASFDDGYQYVKTYGLYLEKDYPFVGRRGRCHELQELELELEKKANIYAVECKAQLQL